MSNTSQALQTIDDAAFEALATSVLRKHSLEYSTIVHTGVNAEGKPVKSPLDGFCKIPHSDPPHFLLVAHTTTKPESLKKKWLHDHTQVKPRKSPKERQSKPPSESDDGDLIKAGREAKEIRTNSTGAIFTVILTTNRRIPLDLQKAVYGKAEELGVDVELWEQSRIVEILDQDPEGQYLRQEFLGIDANRLSETLLREIAIKSLKHHRQRFALRQNRLQEAIEREIHAELMNRIDEPGSALIGLRGASGTGKSTLLRQVGEEINAKDGMALWVPAEDVKSSTSIDHLLLKVLRRFHSSLNQQAGEEAVRLASLLPHGITLLVDDINRLGSPEQALHTVEAWYIFTSGNKTSNRSKGTTDSGSGYSDFSFVVPLWEDLCKRPTVRQQWTFVAIDSYSTQERCALAATFSGNSQEMQKAIDILDGDPLLCGLIAEDVIVPAGISRSSLIRSVLEHAFDEACQEAAALASQSRAVMATTNEFNKAIDGLIELVITDEDPEPQWEYVRQRLGNRAADLLHILGDTNLLGWIASHEDEDIWCWKHHRLRDALMGRWLANELAYEKSTKWQNNPGLAEAWALSLVFMADVSEQIDALKHMVKFQPLVAAVILRLGLFPSEGRLRQVIVNNLVQTLSGFDERARVFVRSPEWFILWELAYADDDLILKITDNLPRGWLVWAARFRNGDISAGLEWIDSDKQRDFLPAMSFQFLEQSIEAFARLYDHQRNTVAEKLAQTMERPELASAVLTLAGYLAWPELTVPVWEAWNQLTHEKKLGTLTPVVWALSRSGDDKAQAQLREALLIVREISDEAKGKGKASDRYGQFMGPLWLSHRWSFTVESAQIWANVAVEHPDLSKALCFVLRGIDHPSTMEVYVRWSAEKGGTMWDPLSEPLDPLGRRPRVPKTPSRSVTREHLWHMVKDEPDLTTRKIALNLWKRMVKFSELDRLRAIHFDDPLFEEVLKARLLLRDKMAVRPLLKLIESESIRWLRYAPLVYSEPGVEKAFLHNLEEGLKNSLIWVCNAPGRLPAYGIRRLLEEKRGVLAEYPETWRSLWRSDVPEALAFVQEVLRSADSENLKGFFTLMGFPFPVSRRMLDSLIPVLDRFPESQKLRLADSAVRAGFIQWTRRYLFEEVSKVERWLTEKRTLEILEEAANLVPEGAETVSREGRISYLKSAIEHRSSTTVPDIKALLRRWLGSEPSPNQITIATILMVDFGDADDVTWWQKLKPFVKEARAVWFNTLWILKRSKWHD
jgi:hypothetical protein